MTSKRVSVDAAADDAVTPDENPGDKSGDKPGQRPGQRPKVKRAKGERSARRRSREFAVQALYAWQLADTPLRDLIAQTSEMEEYTKADEACFKRLLGGAIREAPALREAIGPHIDRPWAELSPVERSILLLAAYELKESQEVPFRVVINEAVEIAKSFGGTDGHRYVNGVLDKLARVLRPLEPAR